MRFHSYLSPKCKAEHNSKIHRFGVFAKKGIKKDELIALWGGYIMTLRERGRLPQEILDYDYPVQIYANFYLGPKSVKDLDDAEMFNHSCDPNAGVRGQNVLIARRNIKKGEEVCFDYETTDTKGLRVMCKCGVVNCRGKIDGTSWKKPEFQKRNWDYLSLYIKDKIENNFRSKSKRLAR